MQKLHGCPATKQVQRSDEDPTIFVITYKGKHTCLQSEALDVVSPSRLNLAALDDSHVMENILDDSVVNTKEDMCNNHRNDLVLLKDGLEDVLLRDGHGEIAIVDSMDNM